MLLITLTLHLPNETKHYTFHSWKALLASRVWETPGRVYLRVIPADKALGIEERVVVTMFGYYGCF